jgi:hypothetical protein
MISFVLALQINKLVVWEVQLQTYWNGHLDRLGYSVGQDEMREKRNGVG